MDKLWAWATFFALCAAFSAFKLFALVLGLRMVSYFLNEFERKLPPNDFTVAIIGAGFSGIAMAIKCKKIGLKYEVFESASEVGGTWRDNVYPGCACDIPAHVYSYSFEPNPFWSKKFAGQPEILGYLKDVSSKYGIRISFNRTVDNIRYDETSEKYKIKFTDGTVTEANFVVSATGMLREPLFPKIAGMEDFKGKAFHSAVWDTSYDLKGKRVAVLGTGASAVQVVPTIANNVSSLFVFQRTPTWSPARNEWNVPAWIQKCFASIPGVMYLHRLYLFFMHEIRYFGLLKRDVHLAWIWRYLFTRRLRNIVTDPSLQEKLLPEYALGCKRITPSDEYWNIFNNPKVALITEPITKITSTGVDTQGGGHFAVDCIIYATGYSPMGSLLNAYEIRNGEGVSLKESVVDVPRFFKGITTATFPNLFFLLGPNTNLNHHSLVYMMECQVNYIADLVRKLIATNARSVVPTQESVDRYNLFIQHHMKNKAFYDGCTSWYRKDMTGINYSLWPCLVVSYWWETLWANLKDFHVK